MKSPSAIAVLIAAGALGPFARAETQDERVARDKTPPPDREPRYIGIDHGAEPGRAINWSAADQERIAAAQAKRDRKAAKRNREAGFQKVASEVPK